MRSIVIGDNVKLDVSKLVESRLLIQANSGGGKSHAVRRLLEETHGQVQQIVLDPEGEFSTLREKFDYVLAGKGGDVAAEPRSAALLAKKILELGVSAIVDLYELPPQDRKHFIRLFLDAMVNAPKELWHPCLVVVDEAHVFVPEHGEAESAGAVIDLCTRGRKRGFCAVLATQRLSKLHKDAAAECNNKLIGRTGLDIDMKRAADELGFTSRDQQHELRNLEPGEFFAYGPAISREIVKVKVGGVQTSHPRIGAKASKPAKPTAEMLKVISKLGDLPKEADEEAKTISELKNELIGTRRELSVARRHVCPKTGTDPEAVEKEVWTATKKLQSKFDQERKAWRYIVERAKTRLETIGKQAADFDATEPVRSGEKITYARHIQNLSDLSPLAKGPQDQGKEAFRVLGHDRARTMPVHHLPADDNHDEATSDDRPIQGGAMRMLQVLVTRHPMRFSKSQLATLAGLSSRSGTYGTYLSLLRSKKLVVEEDSGFQASQAAFDLMGNSPPAPMTSDEIIRMWQGNLQGGARRMFDYLISIHPDSTDKESLATSCGLSAGSGTFGTYMSQLRSNNLVRDHRGMITASEELFI